MNLTRKVVIGLALFSVFFAIKHGYCGTTPSASGSVPQAESAIGTVMGSAGAAAGMANHIAVPNRVYVWNQTTLAWTQPIVYWTQNGHTTTLSAPVLLPGQGAWVINNYALEDIVAYVQVSYDKGGGLGGNWVFAGCAVGSTSCPYVSNAVSYTPTSSAQFAISTFTGSIPFKSSLTNFGTSLGL